MTLLQDIFDVDLLDEMLAEGMVKKTSHPNMRLAILNYTPAAQFSKTWNEVTMRCRGLIYDIETGEVVARPFEKFFNLGEHDSLPDEFFRVFEKMDGSLGILYDDGEGWAIATRGSFTSDQALWATKHLRERYPSFTPEPGSTYLFEIIYPDNRIVVDYSGMEDLVLLEVLDIEDGTPAWDMAWSCWGGPFVEEFVGDTVEDLAKMERPNHEGFVLVYESGLRVKVKHAEYVAMHAIVTNTSSRTIWELLSNGSSLDGLLAFVPDEFADWAKQIAADLHYDFQSVYAMAHLGYQIVTQALAKEDEAFTRKDFAQAVSTLPYKALMFRFFDGRGVDDIIWKMIKPERTLPFRTDMEISA